MPPKRKWDEPVSEEPIYLDEPSEIQRAFADFPENNQVISLSRMPPEGKPGRPGFLEAVSPAEFSMQWVKSVYGGGRFRAIATDNENGERKTIFFDIEGESIKAKTNNEIESEPVRENGFQFIPGSIEERIMRIEQAILKLAEPKQDATLTVILPMMLEMIKAQSGTKEKMLEEIVTYKQLFSPAQSQVDFKTLLDALRQGAEMSGDGSGGTNWLYIAEKLLEKVSPIIEPVLQGIANRKPILPGQPARINSQSLKPGELPQPEAKGLSVFARQLQPFLPFLIQAAAQDDDPIGIAGTIINAIPEAQRPEAIKLLESQTWFQELATFHPGIPLQQKWWNDLHDTVLDSLKNPHEPAEDNESEVVE